MDGDVRVFTATFEEDDEYAGTYANEQPMPMPDGKDF